MFKKSTTKLIVHCYCFCVFLGIGLYPGDETHTTVVIGIGEPSMQVESEKQFAIQVKEDFFSNDYAGQVLETGFIVASIESLRSKLC